MLLTLEAKKGNAIKLRLVRTRLGLTQVELAKHAGIHSNVISRCERGLTISAKSAWAILDALNAEREKRNLPPLGFEEMTWKIQGEP
jgi:transcriptional regulator with XRE-family HTH domain